MVKVVAGHLYELLALAASVVFDHDQCFEAFSIHGINDGGHISVAHV